VQANRGRDTEAGAGGRTKKARRLLTHRTVAQMMDVSTATIREWVRLGEFPLPHSVIARTMFYDAAKVEHYLKTGCWPAGTWFIRGGPYPAPIGEQTDVA
jgi:hypothetical protein